MYWVRRTCGTCVSGVGDETGLHVDGVPARGALPHDCGKNFTFPEGSRGVGDGHKRVPASFARYTLHQLLALLFARRQHVGLLRNQATYQLGW